MIVYFLTKRKEGRAVALVSALVCLGYGAFVFSEVVSGSSSTVQVVSGPDAAAQAVQTVADQPDPADGQGRAGVPADRAFVASKRGTYFYPVSCSKAKTLSSKNTLYFKDISAAEAAGFKAFSGC
jgi:hypothetical protein